MSVLEVINKVLRLIELYRKNLEEVSNLRVENAQLKQDLADSKEREAVALSNDAADKAEIGQAKEAAEAAKREADEAKAQLKIVQESHDQVLDEAKTIKTAFEQVAEKLPEDLNQEPVETVPNTPVPTRSTPDTDNVVITGDVPTTSLPS